MTWTPLLAEILLSVYKPILFTGVIGLWGFAVAYIDKDLDYFYLKRQMWNGINLGVGSLAILLWLVIPLFWVGLFLAILLIIGGFVGYHFYRNTEVPPNAQWTLSLDSFRQKWDEASRRKKQEKTSVAFIGKDKKPVDSPTAEDDPRTPIHQAFENLIDFAFPRRAEQFDILADANESVVSVQIDGVSYPHTKLEARLGLGLIDYLKENSGLDVKDRRRKQVGSVEIDINELGRQKLAITTSGTTKGLILTAEINPQHRAKIKYADLGLLGTQKPQLEAALDADLSRVVLVVAPTRQGVTTTLYALTERHDPYVTNIMTLEQEPSGELEGVTHTPVQTGNDAPPVAQQLRSMLLREPAVMLIGQLADADTAKMVTQHAAETRFYIGLRQADSFTALRAWAQAVGDPAVAAKSLQAIVSQRLIRKLCPQCRLAYKPDAAILRKLNLPVDKVEQLYKHSGQIMVKDQPQPCPACVGMGYRGRTAVFEVMVLTDEARELIGAGQMDQARAQLRKNRMLYLQEAALSKVVEGVTSISEITRVLSAEKKPG